MQGIYAYNSIYNLFNISRRDLKTTSSSPATVAASMIFGTNLKKTYQGLINYDSYESKLSFYSQFHNQLSQLYEDASALTDTESLYSSRSANYESDAATITAEDNATLDSYSILIQQVASGQTSQGEYVNPDALTDIDETNNVIELEANEEITDIFIHREAAQTNKSLLSEIAMAINNENLDINASIHENEDNDISLILRSKETGAEGNFQLHGNLADALNLNNITETAKDSIVEVNKEILTSGTNLLELDDGKISVKIDEETSIPFDLYIEVSGNGALASVKRFANNFNATMLYLLGLHNAQSELLRNQLIQDIQDNSDTFKDVGITLDAKRQLQIDEAELSKAFESGNKNSAEKIENLSKALKQVTKKTELALKAPIDTFQPSTNLPRKVAPFTLGYTSDLQNFPVQALFTKGSVIDVFF